MKKTRKLLIVCLALVLVAALITTVACNKHKHDYSDWDSNSTQHWKVCPEDGVADESTKANHDWAVDAASSQNREATCTAKGVQAYKCSVCGATKTEETDMIDHDLGDLNSAVAPDCGNDGTLAYKQCSKCNQYFDAEGNTLSSIVDPATGEHDWQEDPDSLLNKEATCTEKGVKAYKCGTCNATKTEESDMIDHDLSGELVEAVAPDCGHDGTVAHRQCSMCEQYFDAEGNLLGDSEEAIVDPATGEHSWEEDEESEENVEATCGAPGVKAYKCSVCEATKTEPVEPTGEHSWEDDNDESRAGEKVEASCAPGVQPTKCSECGELSTRELEPTGAHDFADVELTQEVPATCTADGVKAHKACNNCGLFCDENGDLIGDGKEEDLVIEKIPHKMIDDEDAEGKVEATCGAPGVQPTKCEYECGETGTREIPATGEHTYDRYEAVDSWTHNVFCSVCGEEQEGNPVACTGEWSYDADGHHRSCEFCTNEENTSHTAKTSGGSYLAGTGTHSVACSVAGCTEMLTEDCNNKETGTCSVCRHVYVPSIQYIVVGSTNGTNWSETTTKKELIFNYDHETKVYSLEISFKTGDEWNVKRNSSGWTGQLKGSNLTGTTFAEGVDPVSDLFSGSANIKVWYDCTVVITLNANQTSMSVLVKSVDNSGSTTKYYYTFHVYCGVASIGPNLQFEIWGDISESGWNGNKVTAEAGHPGWYTFVSTQTSEITGTVSLIIHAGDTKYVTFGEGGGIVSTMNKVTIAPDMYFVYNKAEVYTTREDAETAAGVSAASLEAVLPVKFELAA